jgi:hypothetical protein
MRLSREVFVEREYKGLLYDQTLSFCLIIT